MVTYAVDGTLPFQNTPENYAKENEIGTRRCQGDASGTSKVGDNTPGSLASNQLNVSQNLLKLKAP